MGAFCLFCHYKIRSFGSLLTYKFSNCIEVLFVLYRSQTILEASRNQSISISPLLIAMETAPPTDSTLSFAYILEVWVLTVA